MSLTYKIMWQEDNVMNLVVGQFFHVAQKGLDSDQYALDGPIDAERLYKEVYEERHPYLGCGKFESPRRIGQSTDNDSMSSSYRKFLQIVKTMVEFEPRAYFSTHRIFEANGM